MSRQAAELGSTGGVILRREALAMGYDDRAIAAMVRSGQWCRVRHGSYVECRLWKSLDGEDRHRVRSRAVLRAAKSPAALSHVSGALEWGADVWDVDLSDVSITRLDGKTGRREAGVSQHRGHVPPTSIVIRDGVPVLDAARTAVDVTRVTDVQHGLPIVNSMLHARATTLDDVRSAARVLDGWPDTLATRIVIGLADHRVESVAESLFVHLAWTQALPRMEPQYAIRDRFGSVVARVDFALPELGVFFEIDGRVKYENLPAGQSLEQVLKQERDREKLVCRLTGWVCIRITWRDLMQPERLAREIREVLRSRRWSPGAPA